MACKQMLAAVAASMALLVFLPTLASATDHVVGDTQGWRMGFDYAGWAEGKQFTVGDTLTFNYASGFHNVAEVSGLDFEACNKRGVIALWNSGNDVVSLDKPGRRWFICAVGSHCQAGMKLNVTILPATRTPAPLPAPAPTPLPAPAPVIIFEEFGGAKAPTAPAPAMSRRLLRALNA